MTSLALLSLTWILTGFGILGLLRAISLRLHRLLTRCLSFKKSGGLKRLELRRLRIKKPFFTFYLSECARQRRLSRLRASRERRLARIHGFWDSFRALSGGDF